MSVVDPPVLPNADGARRGREASEGDAAAPDAADAALLDAVRARPRLFVLGGAGCSTAAGLGDYRDRQGRWKRKQPITGQTFRSDEAMRKRYWARSSVGWPAFSAARPAAAHRALVRLQRLGTARHLVTQNVDGLHGAAGHEGAIDLHGRLDRVVCLGCGRITARDAFQRRLLGANPWLAGLSAAHAPDGDADLELADVERLTVPGCEACGAMLKPDVVFFGENVPRERVEDALARLADSDALLVAGSSLMVFSGYRFARAAAASGRPVLIVNDGVTRADGLAALRVGGDVGARLARLADALEGRARPDAGQIPIGGASAAHPNG